MEKNWVSILSQKKQLAEVMETNRRTERFGLVLREEDAKLILAERSNVLREQRRVEFGGGITLKLIYEFCDSPYISQDTYVDTILRLQEIFYLYKNETGDAITDEELLQLMKKAFDGVCHGDPEYLEGTYLEEYSRALRRGYRGYLDFLEMLEEEE
ncbi:MAG: hypothetical protein J6D13_06045 [Clostridium sp.]|nr:hypothetical protein [Clostridium sp.]